jgi:hypothetical protein
VTRGSSRLQTAVVALLCAVVAALAATNWWVLQFDPAPAPAGGRIMLASAGTIPVTLSRPSEESALSEFDEIVRRPVFAASRRPFVPSAPTAVQPPARALPPPDVRVIGISINAGKKQALLRSAQQPRGRWIGEGESIDGWVLRNVRADAVVIASGQQSHELRLYPALGQAKQ